MVHEVTVAAFEVGELGSDSVWCTAEPLIDRSQRLRLTPAHNIILAVLGHKKRIRTDVRMWQMAGAHPALQRFQPRASQ